MCILYNNCSPVKEQFREIIESSILTYDLWYVYDDMKHVKCATSLNWVKYNPVCTVSVIQCQVSIRYNIKHCKIPTLTWFSLHVIYRTYSLNHHILSYQIIRRMQTFPYALFITSNLQTSVRLVEFHIRMREARTHMWYSSRTETHLKCYITCHLSLTL